MVGMAAGKARTTSGPRTTGTDVAGPNKSLGQHWLTDRLILSGIAEAAEIEPTDTVLEIGPGLGTLTSELLRRADNVVAVELDESLAAKLPGQFPGKNLTVVNQDILQYDLSQLPSGYVVVANVPYYITSKIIQHLLTSDNRPRTIVLLIQKEVAERVAAGPGDMSLLALSAQIYARAALDQLVPAEYFTPPPKVDSQVVVLQTRPEPLVPASEQPDFFRVTKAGFSAKRKKLRSSLSGGLGLSKDKVETMLAAAEVSPDARAEDLSVDDWRRVVRAWGTILHS